MSILFGNTRGAASLPASRIEFKAGRTSLQNGSEPSSRKVVPLEGKGLVYIMNSNDGLLHFYWKNRETNMNELDLILFPEDSEFLKVKECKDGRVYMLKFKSSNQRHLFWMQEPRASKDEEICKKVNDILRNNQSMQGIGRVGGSADRNLPANVVPGFPGLNFYGAGDLNALQNMDQNQLMRFYNMAGGNALGSAFPVDQLIPQLFPSSRKATGSSASQPSSVTKPVVGTMPSYGGVSSSSFSQQQKQPSTTVLPPATSAAPTVTADTLAAVIAATAVSSEQGLELASVFSRSNVEEFVKTNADSLYNLLPDQTPLLDKDSELGQTLGDPQFQHASNYLGSALQTGQLGPLLQQFGFKQDIVNAASSGDILRFAEKLTDDQGQNHSNVDEEINRHADSEETLDSAAKKSGSSEDKSIEKKEPPKPFKDDDMELD